MRSSDCSGGRRFWTLRITLAAAALGAILLAPLTALTQANVQTFDIEIRNGAVTGSKSARVKRGDTVLLRWASDKPLELHLHGYDVTVKAAPGAPAEMTIHARATGRFPVAVHGQRGTGGHGHHTIFHLEVYPD
jgi:hypothetical protein